MLDHVQHDKKNMTDQNDNNSSNHNPQQKDSYQSYPKTPHLSDRELTKTEIKLSSDYHELHNELTNITDKEEFYNVLRRFKKKKYETIQNLESDPLKNRKKILERISNVADAILQKAYEFSQNELVSQYGRPSYLASYKQLQPCEFAIVGMGKLAGKEINYESDLDLIFIYSHIGQTTGEKSIRNSEYYSKLVQKLIHMLSLLTEAGRCFEVDAELRPSGNSGSLVISFDHFLDHQMNQAQDWERMALLRNRIVVAEPHFHFRLKTHLQELAYQRPLPPQFFKTMHNIRNRVLQEKTNSSKNTFDIKLGQGGLMDIEFIVQGLQLKNQMVYKDLAQSNTFEIIDVLEKHNLLNQNQTTLLKESYTLYRTLESQLHILKKRSEHILYFEREDMAVIATKLGFSDKKLLQDHLNLLRKEVRNLYRIIYENT